MSDTIYALATPPGRGAVAVVRCSGPLAGAAVDTLAGGRPAPRMASLRRLRWAGEVLDEALVLWFPAPASYTGEDGAEFHVHGGRATVEALSEALEALGLRPALPGEFTRRAFEHGRLGLAQAEAVADLVDAETAAQRRQALDQLGGALDRRHADWRRDLLALAGLLEAAVDFPDEEVPPDIRAEVAVRLNALRAELAAAVDDRRGEVVRDGFRIALLGAPNAGKSSLLNRLTGVDAVIVSPQAGTTRDVVALPYQAGPYRVWLADMAGVRASDDPVEAEGVRRALAWAADASLRLLVVDGSGDGEAWAELAGEARPGDLLVLNKADLPPGRAERLATDPPPSLAILAVSAAMGEGVAELEAWLQARVAEALGGADFPAVTRRRHRALIAEALSAVDRATAAADLSAELIAENVRLAARALERITGRVGSEDVLGEVFARFCIGK